MIKVLRITAMVVVVILLLSSVWLGMIEGADILGDAQNALQRVAAAVQFLYGIFAVLALFALLRHARWGKLAILAWAGLITATGALAPIAWGGADWKSAVAGGCLTLGIACLTAWAYLAQLRRDPITD